MTHRERRALVVELYRTGVPVRDIMAQVHAAHRTVYHILNRAGVVLQRRGRYPLVPALVRDRILALYAQGCPYREIMALTGVSHGSVTLAVRRAGLPPRMAYAPRGRERAQWGGASRLKPTAGTHEPTTLRRRCARCLGVAEGPTCPNGHPFEEVA